MIRAGLNWKRSVLVRVSSYFISKNGEFYVISEKNRWSNEKLHEGSDAAEEERRKEAGEPYEEMERPELEKGDIPAMIIAAFITFIPVAILVLGIILVAGYFLLH